MSPSIFWMVGGIFILIGVGLWLKDRYGPMPVPQPADPASLQDFRLEQSKFPEGVEDHGLGDVVIESPTAEELADVPPDTAADVWEMVSRLRAALRSEPWDDPYMYREVLFDDANEIRMVFHLPDGGYVIPAFRVEGWQDGILDSDFFNVGQSTGVAYVDEQNRLVLWVHSGLGQVMTVMQLYVELNDKGNRARYQVADERLSDMIGSEVYIAQGEEYYNFSKITAAVRVPPSGVDGVTDHVMDLIPYLAETYPDSGFDVVDRSDEALILYFCGRALAGEKQNPDFDHWTQARIIIGLVPMEVVDETLTSSQGRN